MGAKVERDESGKRQVPGDAHILTPGTVTLGESFPAEAVMLSSLRCRVFLGYPVGRKWNYLCLCEWRQREVWQRDRTEGHVTTSQDGVVRPQVMELPEHQKLEEAKRRLGGGEAQGGDTHTHTHTRTCFWPIHVVWQKPTWLWSSSPPIKTLLK